MQRILRTFPKFLVQPTYTWTVVPSRSFARGRKPVEDPNKARDEQMSKLWKDLEESEFGKEFDKFIDNHVASGKDENDLIREYLAKNDVQKDADKIAKSAGAQKLNNTDSYSGETKAVDLRNIEIDPKLEEMFAREIGRMESGKKNQMLNDFKGFFDVLDQFTSRGEQQQSGGQQTPPKVATNKPPKTKKNPKKGN